MTEASRSQGPVVDAVVDFLRKVPPFQFLDEPLLRAVAASATVEYFPAGTVLLSQDGPPSDSLLVIKKGSAKVFVRSPENEESLLDYRAEGDVIGFVSIYTGDRSRSNIVTTADTICYRIGREAFRALLDSSPAVREYLHRSFLRKYLDKTLHEMQTRSLFVGGGERLLFTTPLGELATGPVVSAPRGVSIQAAAEMMSLRDISSLVLLEADGSPAGILTDRDIRDKVVATGAGVDGRADSIMQSRLVTADAHDYCFEALLAMIQHGIHHVLVTEGGALRGIITNHDLMILQGTSPLSVSHEIEYQQDLGGLALVSRKVNRIVALLLKDGARASAITRVVTEVNDRIVRRVLEIAERKVGPPPVRYAWLAFGSEGRGEQAFRTDQDNGLVYEDPIDEGTAAAAAEWAAAFTAFARDALVACGFPACPGGFMASNPLWRQPLSVWRRYFSEWVDAPMGEGPMRTMIFFDFRVLHGEALLGERLRDHVVARLAEGRVFLNYVVGQVATNRPPVGFLGSFVVEKSGEHKNLLNLKARAINPLLDLVRFFALERGVRETGTLARIAALAGQPTIVRDFADELAQAFDFLLLLRMHSQYRQEAEGVPINNFIDPNRLSSLERRTVKEAFQVVSQVQDQVLERYKSLIL